MSNTLQEWEAQQDRAERRRWGMSAAVVLVAYVGFVGAFNSIKPQAPATPRPPEVVMMLELAPEPKAPEPAPPEPPPPEPPKPKPVLKPVPLPPPKVEAPPPSDIALPDAPEPPPEPVMEQAAAPSVVAPRIDPRIAAQARVTYEGLLLAHLERKKRYPSMARSRRLEGVPQVRFTATREGRVLNASLVRSCGHPLLDEEALELLKRAEPLPRFTAEMEGDSLDVVVPIQFALRRH